MKPEIFNKLKEVYTFARTNSAVYKELPLTVTPEQWKHIPLLSAATLRTAPSLLAYPESEVRYVVSEFTPAHPENLFLVPRRLEEPWQLLGAEIDEIKPFVAAYLAPLFWQVAPIFYATFRSKTVPVSVLAPRNLPLAVQVIKEAKVDMVVSTPEVAQELQALLLEANLGSSIRAWHLIVPFGEKVAAPKVAAPYIIEHHLFPGIPVARSMPDGTIASLPGYYFEIGEGGECIISSLEKHALPLVRYQSGVRLSQQSENTFLLV